MSIESKLAIVIAVLCIITYLWERNIKEPEFEPDAWTYESELRLLKVGTVFTFLDSQSGYCIVNDDGMTFSYVGHTKSVWRINEINRNATVRVQGVMTDG